MTLLRVPARSAVCNTHRLECSLPCHSRLPGLESLDLSGNELQEVPALGSAPQLRHLALHDNHKVVLTTSNVQRLAAQAPNLDTLFIHGPAAAAARLIRQLPGLHIW